MFFLRIFQDVFKCWKDIYWNEFFRIIDLDVYKLMICFVVIGVNKMDWLNEVWEIDVLLFDVMIMDGCKMFYVVIDFYFCCMFIFVIDMLCVFVVVLILCKCFLVWGVLEIVKIDNGFDFVVKVIKWLLDVFGIEYDLFVFYLLE